MKLVTLGFACCLWCVRCASAVGQEIHPRADQQCLSSDDKTEIADVLRLQGHLGEEAWPGFGRVKIPIVLYDDRSQFLIGEVAPPSPWRVVQSDSFAGHFYYYRDLARARSFAVRVGNSWAGSLSTLGEMNRKLPMKLRRDVHMVALLHEMFHAFQATEAPGRFTEATSVYSLEGRYPFHDSAFAAAWDREGLLLARALRATEDTSKRNAVREFLAVREARRVHAAMEPNLVAFERELEWLEGLGKYVEVRLYELAASQTDSTWTVFGGSTPYASQLMILEHQLGRQSGDLRFYLSGMAQARLLDYLSPGWKQKALDRQVFLEDLLRGSLYQSGHSNNRVQLSRRQLTTAYMLRLAPRN